MDEPVIEQVAPSNITINGTEYSPEDAQALIELGTKTRELEKSWNSPVDKLASAYGKSQSELTEARKEIESFKAKQQEGTETPKDLEDAKEAARKLGIVLSEDLDKTGYVKKDDLEKYLAERDEKINSVKELEAEGKKLEAEINGEDGRPRFNYKMTLAWAAQYGKTSLMDAYKDMHDEQLKAWEQKQIEAKKNPSLKTFKPGTLKKEPTETKVGDDNVKDLMRETLWGAKE